MFGQRDDTSAQDAGVVPSTAAAPAVSSFSMPDPIQTAASTPAPTMPAFVTAMHDQAPVPSVSPSPAPSAPALPVTVQAPTEELTSDTTEELARMKQEALKHLQPLVGTLQQSPEEEFRTLMMMIQATDDRTMLKKALEAAKNIKDDKVRAQAMLDVINEINYFTQSGGSLEDK
jgi:hypothetical protein